METTRVMSLDEYKTYITNIINRLIKENLLEININKTDSNMTIKVNIKNSEWYLDYDEDTRYNVETHIRILYTPKIIEALKDTVEDETHVNKKAKTSA